MVPPLSPRPVFLTFKTQMFFMPVCVKYVFIVSGSSGLFLRIVSVQRRRRARQEIARDQVTEATPTLTQLNPKTQFLC